MAWETRERGTRYYTRCVRVNGRVTRQYFGCGPAGEFAATEDAPKRVEREAAAQALRTERDRVVVANRPLTEFLQVSDLLVQAALMEAGFYRHNPGEWRKTQWKARIWLNWSTRPGRAIKRLCRH